MKLNDEQKKQYYAAQGIDRSDLVSEGDIRLAELPPDVSLDEPARLMVEQIVQDWNALAPLSKIDAARAMERRVLKRRPAPMFDIHIPAEAWCAYLFLGRLRDCEARREVMQKIARGEMTPAEARPVRRGRKVTAEQRQDAPRLARLHDAGVTRVRRETPREKGQAGEPLTIHHLRLTRD